LGLSGRQGWLAWKRPVEIDAASRTEVQQHMKRQEEKGLERPRTKGLAALTPAAIWYPEISVGAPGKVIRDNPEGTGGYIRRPSSRQASMYGNLAVALVKLISSSFSKALRTSSITLRSAFGVRSNQYVTPDSNVAVVSDPATIRTVEFDASSASVSPSLVPRCLSIESIKSGLPCKALSYIRFIATLLV